MAPPVQYMRPIEQLADSLADARLSGLSFEDAWARAVRPRLPLVMTTSRDAPTGAVRWPTDRNDRVAWQTAIHQTRGVWQIEYEGLPRPSRVEAVNVLLGLLVPDDAPGRAPALV